MFPPTGECHFEDRLGTKALPHELHHVLQPGTPESLHPTAREQELRDFLGGFDFRGDMATHPVGRFSGGEKARLALDANNFACLRQDYLGLRLTAKKNAQGESRFMLDTVTHGPVIGLDVRF